MLFPKLLPPYAIPSSFLCSAPQTVGLKFYTSFNTLLKGHFQSFPYTPQLWNFHISGPGPDSFHVPSYLVFITSPWSLLVSPLSDKETQALWCTVCSRWVSGRVKVWTCMRMNFEAHIYLFPSSLIVSVVISLKTTNLKSGMCIPQYPYNIVILFIQKVGLKHLCVPECLLSWLE